MPHCSKTHSLLIAYAQASKITLLKILLLEFLQSPSGKLTSDIFELISLATKAKKLNQETINSFIELIKSLEKAHKRTQALSALQDLLHTRSLLRAELDKRSSRRYILGQRIFYEHSNKCGRLLAHSVQSSKTSTRIHHIRNTKGDLLVRNEDIAKEFKVFYSKAVYPSL